MGIQRIFPFLMGAFILAACNRPLDSGNPQTTGIRKVDGQTVSFHPAGWFHAQNHGAAFLAAKNKQTCLMCHAEDSQFKVQNPTLFVSCATCHLPMPHSKAFIDNHEPTGRLQGNQCILCHQDYKRNTPTLGKDGCYSCHDGQVLDVKIEWIAPPKPKEEPKSGSSTNSPAKKDESALDKKSDRSVASEKKKSKNPSGPLPRSSKPNLPGP